MKSKIKNKRVFFGSKNAKKIPKAKIVKVSAREERLASQLAANRARNQYLRDAARLYDAAAQALGTARLMNDKKAVPIIKEAMSVAVVASSKAALATAEHFEVPHPVAVITASRASDLKMEIVRERVLTDILQSRLEKDMGKYSDLLDEIKSVVESQTASV